MSTTTIVDSGGQDPYIGYNPGKACEGGVLTHEQGRAICHKTLIETASSQLSDEIGMLDGALVLLLAVLVYALRRKREFAK